MFQVGLEEEVPYQEFKDYLEEGNYIYVAEDRLNRAVRIMESKIKSRYDQLITSISGVTGIQLHTIGKQDIINYLIGVGVPEEYFCKRGKDQPIYYNKDIMTKIILNDYTCEVFFMYEDYQKMKRSLSSIKNLFRRQANSERIEGNNGEVLIRVPYKVIPTLNRRFSTADENTIGFYGDLRKSFAAPKDYYILSCDFPQIDAKAALNMYLKNDMLDKLTDEVDDTYLLFKEYARYIAHQHDLKTLDDAGKLEYYTDTEEVEKRVNNYTEQVIPFAAKGIRDIYKVTALKTAYYSRHSAIPAEARAMRELTLMYESTERYKRILSMIKLMFNLKIPVEMKSRWGHKRMIVERNLWSTLSTALNAPIQTTSSEAIIFYVVHFLDYFRKQGIGPDEVRICLNRHDEPVFYIKKEVYHQHLHFIAGMRTYLIQGWAPLTLDIFVGNYYGENLPEASEAIERMPLMTERAKLESKRYKDQEEPYALVEPEMLSIAYRKMKDGNMKVAFVSNVGPFPKDYVLDDNYEDRRPFKVKVLSFKTDETRMTHELLQQVTNNFSNKDNSEDAYLVLAPYGFNQDILLDKRTCHFRNFGGSVGHLLAQGTLAVIAKQTEPENITKDDKQMITYLEDNKWRFQR